MKMIRIILAITCLAAMYNCATFSTKSKSRKLMMAEDVLDSLKRFNNKYSGLKDNYSEIGHNQLEAESKSLDLKFGDLLKVFTEPSFISKSESASVMENPATAAPAKNLK